MLVLKKRFWIIFLLAGAYIQVFGDLQKDTKAPAADFKPRRAFTVDSSLMMEFLNYDYWSSPRFACSGNLVAYAVVDKYYERSKEEEAGRFWIPQGSHIFIRSLRGGEPQQITEGTDYSWSPSWSPDGNKLAFFGLHHDKVLIGLWDRITNKREYYSDPGHLFGRDSIEWDPQNQKIYFLSNPSGWKGPVEPYDRSEDPILRTTSQATNSYDERFLSGYVSQLMSFDFTTKKKELLTPPAAVIISRRVSPNGEYIAVLEKTTNKIPVVAASIGKLAIYPTAGGAPKVVVAESGLTQYSWSSDSRFMAYVDGGQLFAYSLSDEKTISLNREGLEVTGMPLWLPGAQKIFCEAGKGYYFFHVQTGKTDVVGINIPFAVESYFMDEQGQRIYFKISDKETGGQGLFRVNLSNGRPEELVLGPWMVSNATLAGSHLFFTLQNATTPENIWAINLQTKRKSQITELNKSASEFNFGKAELISWNSTSGDPLKGVMLYPADYEKGKKYPIIFWIYETFSSELHHFYVHLYNLQVLTNQGYAVFLPDVAFALGDTSLSYIRSIEPALDRLLELGIANGNFGVMGHSFGGYATAAVVTHTKRFKAAVAISGITNWVSYHGSHADFVRLSNEKGQGRMGGDLREVPERYINNSPVFYLHHVETPLMIIHGTKDYLVPFSQAEEMYYGLRHLNRAAVLIGYPGEEHLYWGTRIRVIKDMWTRILAWFEDYLKR